MSNQEKQLISRLKSRDKEALSELYDSYSPALFGIAVKIVQSHQTAEDVLQEAFVKIWKNSIHYDVTKGSLFTWMLNITRNTAIDKTRSVHYRNNGRTQEIDKHILNHKTLKTTYNPEYIGLKGLVDNLDERYRNVIELAYFHGFTQIEITKELNIPLGTVKSRLRIALRELRKLFTECKTISIILGILILSIFYRIL